MTKLTHLAATAAFALISTAALAAPVVTATTDLNIRSGPGPRFPVVGVIGAGEPARLKGCMEGSKWCSVENAGAEGWVSSDYLSSESGGKSYVLTERPADSGITVVQAPKNLGDAGAATGAVGGAIAGAIVGGPIGAAVGGVAGATVGGGVGTAIKPPAQVTTYIASNPGEPVYLDGEAVVGATIPKTVKVREIPDYKYRYVNVNGQEVLVEPDTNRIVYIVR